MKKYYNKIKINNYSYIFILICFLCGYIKNITIIFFICLIHEFGHVFFIKLFKYEILKVEFFPFGGYTTINKKINTSINKDIIISFGGIFFQIISLCIIYIFKEQFNIITYNMIINYNKVFILFNLIPIIPLDGNKILHLCLEKHFPYNKSFYINWFFSNVILIIFLVINHIYKINNYFIFSFLIYQDVIYLKDFKHLKNRFLLERYLYDNEYKKIDNHTKTLSGLKKEVFHYFKENNKYKSEKSKLKELLFKI